MSCGLLFLLLTLPGICIGVKNPDENAYQSLSAPRSPRFPRPNSDTQNKGHPGCVSLGEEDEPTYLPNVEDCHKFFLCHKHQSYRFTCPFPTQFNSVTQSCIWTGKFDCLKDSSHYTASKEKKPAESSYNEDKVEEPYPNLTDKKRIKTTTHEVKVAQPDNQDVTPDESYYNLNARAYSSPTINYPSTPPVPIRDDLEFDPSYSDSTSETLSNAKPSPSPETASVLRGWINFAFIDSYKDNLNPPENEVKFGERIYKILGSAHYGQSSLNQNISLDEMTAIVDGFYSQGLIPKGEYDVQKSLLLYSPKFFNTIREHVLLVGSSELVYGLTGLIQTSKRHPLGVRGTIVSSFQRFKLKFPINYVAYARSQKLEDCIMWGQYCKTNLILGTLPVPLGNVLLSYMRFEALTQFKNEFGEVAQSLLKESTQNIPLLPYEVRVAVLKVNKSGQDRADLALEEGALNGDKLGL